MLRRPTILGRVVLSAVALVALVALAVATLTALAPAPKYLGNVIHGAHFPEDFDRLWDQVTPENHAKWRFVEGARDAPDWTALDGIYDHAEANGAPVRYHALVWGREVPDWVTGLSPGEQREELAEWIAEAGERYGDRTAMVDVVNEPFHEVPAYAPAIGGTGSTGWDWVVWSFEQARAAFPDAELAINEYDILFDLGLAERYAELATVLKNRGLIDAIGVQAHHSDQADPATIGAALDVLEATGLPVHITELDISGSDAGQLESYRAVFPALWEHPGVAGVTLWGYEEGRMWAPDAFLVRSDGSARPALTWLLDYTGRSGQRGDTRDAP